MFADLGAWRSQRRSYPLRRPPPPRHGETRNFLSLILELRPLNYSTSETPCRAHIHQRSDKASLGAKAGRAHHTIILRSMLPEKKDAPGPFSRHRTISEWPAREARMPRRENPGILHSFSALSWHAVTRTCSSPGSFSTRRDVIPDDSPCCRKKGRGCSSRLRGKAGPRDR